MPAAYRAKISHYQHERSDAQARAACLTEARTALAKGEIDQQEEDELEELYRKAVVDGKVTPGEASEHQVIRLTALSVLALHIQFPLTPMPSRLGYCPPPGYVAWSLLGQWQGRQ